MASRGVHNPSRICARTPLHQSQTALTAKPAGRSGRYRERGIYAIEQHVAEARYGILPAHRAFLQTQDDSVSSAHILPPAGDTGKVKPKGAKSAPVVVSLAVSIEQHFDLAVCEPLVQLSHYVPP